MYVYIPVVTEDKSSLSLLSPSSTATLGTFGVVGESSNSINLHLLNFFLGLMGDPLGEPADRIAYLCINGGYGKKGVKIHACRNFLNASQMLLPTEPLELWRWNRR